MKQLLTKDNLHNLHFKETKFYSTDWKDKNMYLRQIAFDTNGVITTWFALDSDTSDLYIYFEAFGGKDNPVLINKGVLPYLHIASVRFLSNLEYDILNVILNFSYDELKNIRTTEDLNEWILKEKY